jgi:catechol 2,3-dioxygenase-like lactoylglutathione lyase family enzyme
MAGHRCYVEHVAIPVRDLEWHVRFFGEAMGMPVRAVDGPADRPRQVWLEGGVQLVRDPGFAGPEGRLAHLGVMTDDLDAALAAVRHWGVRELPQGRNWIALPEGLCIEFIQAVGNAVAEALAIDPRG